MMICIDSGSYNLAMNVFSKIHVLMLLEHYQCNDVDFIYMFCGLLISQVILSCQIRPVGLISSKTCHIRFKDYRFKPIYSGNSLFWALFQVYFDNLNYYIVDSIKKY